MKEVLVEQEWQDDLGVLDEESVSLDLLDQGQHQEQYPDQYQAQHQDRHHDQYRDQYQNQRQEQHQNQYQDQNPNFLQDYVLAEPTPIVRKTNTQDVTRKHGKRKIWIAIIIIMLVVVLSGAGGWWLWQESQTETVAEDSQDELIEEPVYLSILDLTQEDVTKTFEIIQQVTYGEPFVSFYPMGELTSDDLSTAQREILLGDEKSEISQDDNITTSLIDTETLRGEIIMPQDETNSSDDNYVHILYLAEYDTENLYLSEVVMKTRLIPCVEEVTSLDAICTNYYNLSGKLLEINADDVANGELQNRDVEIDKYRWTFRKVGNNNYVFDKVTRINENSQN